MRRLPYLLAAFVMVALFALGVPIAAGFFAAPKNVKADSLSDFLEGRAALSFESGYEETIFFRDFSIGLFNALAFSAFGEARKGALVGENGWLFTREEFEIPADAWENLTGNLTLAREAAEALEARGVDLSIALVPTKADIHGEHLGGLALPRHPTADYAELRRRLIEATGATVPDLRTAFLAAKPQGELFLKRDTHWTVLGADIAAKVLAAELAGHAGKQAFSPLQGEPVLHTGDLTRFLSFGPFDQALGLPPELITPVSAQAGYADVDSFLDGEGGSLTPPIALVGTSYSANALWSFDAVLRMRMAADVINFAREGQGPFRPMSELLASGDAALQQTSLVIWEIPVRYLNKPEKAP